MTVEDCIATFNALWFLIVGMILLQIFVIDKICPPLPNGKDKYRGWEGWEL